MELVHTQWGVDIQQRVVLWKVPVRDDNGDEHFVVLVWTPEQMEEFLEKFPQMVRLMLEQIKEAEQLRTQGYFVMPPTTFDN